jgi:hypothetical protein
VSRTKAEFVLTIHCCAAYCSLLHTYMHTCIHTFHGYISVSQREQGIEQLINTHIHSCYIAKYYSQFTKQRSKSSAHTNNSSTQ